MRLYSKEAKSYKLLGFVCEFGGGGEGRVLEGGK
jgi:hypothetical protein